MSKTQRRDAALNIPAELYDRLRMFARERGVTISSLGVDAIERFLDAEFPPRSTHDHHAEE